MQDNEIRFGKTIPEIFDMAIAISGHLVTRNEGIGNGRVINDLVTYIRARL